MNKYLNALYGAVVYGKLKKRYKIEDDDFLIILANEQDLNGCVIEYLPTFIKKKYIERCIVLGGDEWDMVSRPIEYYKIDSSQKEALINYYLLRPFKGEMIIASLNEPFGSYGLLNKGNITLNDIVENYMMV